MKIGKFVIREPLTLFSEDKAGAFASAALTGNIGARIASKFKLFLDYGRGQVIFEPNSSFNDPFLQTSAGLSLVAEGDDFSSFRVIGVLENSPASEVALRKDDVIIAVDGQPSKSLTLSRLNEMFEQPVVRKLTIRRGESTLEITLTPRRLI